MNQDVLVWKPGFQWVISGSEIFLSWIYLDSSFPSRFTLTAFSSLIIKLSGVQTEPANFSLQKAASLYQYLIVILIGLAILSLIASVWLWIMRKQVGSKTAELRQLQAELETQVQLRTAELASVNQQLLETQRQQRALLDSIPDIAWLKDRESRFIAVNQPFAAACGSEPELLVGKTDLDVWPEELANNYRSDDRLVLESGRPKKVEEQLVSADGSQHWIETIKVPIISKTGEVVGTAGIARDITERKQVDEDLKLYRERLENLAAERTNELETANQQLIKDVSEQKQAEERIERQLQNLAALRIVDIAITASADLPKNLNVIVGLVIDQLKVDAADVLILDGTSHKLTYATGQGFRSARLKDLSLDLGAGYAGKAAQEQRMVKIFKPADDERRLLSGQLLAGEEFKSYCGVPLISKGDLKGVLEVFSREEINPDEEWIKFLQAMAGQTAIAIDNATLYNDLEQANIELIQAYEATIEGWAKALELRDGETEGHSKRVTEMTLRLASHMGVGESDLIHIRRGAILHDIGKMAIPDSILLKPDRLTPDEWQIMTLHPIYGRDFLAHISFLKPALDIPYYHHERWDGSGYPCGLKGEEIPLAARIFAVVDVWDALCSHRPYHKAASEAETLKYIHEQSGKLFDPCVVDIFTQLRESPNYLPEISKPMDGQ